MWSELSAEHDVRYTAVERFLVITMPKTSGWQRDCIGWQLGCPVQISDTSSSRQSRRSFPRRVLSREFQSTCLAMRSPAIKTGSPPPKQAVSSAPI